MREHERSIYDADARMLQRFQGVEDEGTAGTLFYDGRLITLMGYREMWQGVYEVWTIPSVYVEKYPLVYLRTVKRYVRLIEVTHCVHRLQTASRAHPIEDRWMRFLGFTPGGLMEQFTADKQDYRMWAKVYKAKP